MLEDIIVDEDNPGGGSTQPTINAYVTFNIARIYPKGDRPSWWLAEFENSGSDYYDNDEYVACHCSVSLDRPAPENFQLDFNLHMQYKMPPTYSPVIMGVGGNVYAGETTFGYNAGMFSKHPIFMGYNKFHDQYVVPVVSSITPEYVNVIFDKPVYKIIPTVLKGDVKIDWLYRDGEKIKLRSWVTTNVDNYNLVSYNKCRTNFVGNTEHPMFESAMDHTQLTTVTDHYLYFDKTHSNVIQFTDGLFFPPYYERLGTGLSTKAELNLLTDSITVPAYSTTTTYNGAYPMEVDDYVGPPPPVDDPIFEPS